LLVVHARVMRDLRQVAAHEREVMMLVGLADARDALHRLLVADVAAERVAGVRRVHDDAALTDQGHRLPYEARLRVLGVDLEITAGHPMFLYRGSPAGESRLAGSALTYHTRPLLPLRRVHAAASRPPPRHSVFCHLPLFRHLRRD